MKFTAELSERDEFDLILIAKNDNNDWQPEASKLARKELERRGLSDDEINQSYKEILDDGKREYKAILKKRKIEDFDLWEKVFKTLWWPKTLLFESNLKKEGYDLKAKRRTQLIGLGIVLWIIFLVYANVDADKREQNLIDEIDKVDNSKWEERMLWNSTEDSL